jgi:hypothetical protein
MCSTVSLGAFTVFTYVGITCSRRLQLQVLPCVKEDGGIRHAMTVQAPPLWCRLYFQFVDANFRAYVENGQNNYKCEYFNCLSTWHTTHMYYISRTQHQFIFTNLFMATCFGSNCDPSSGMMIPCGSKQIWVSNEQYCALCWLNVADWLLKIHRMNNIKIYKQSCFILTLLLRYENNHVYRLCNNSKRKNNRVAVYHQSKRRLSNDV